MNNTLFVAWRAGGPDNGHWGPVGRLEHVPSGYRFVYTRGARTLEGFTPFPEMPELGAVYESDELFPLFANRLLTPSRPEYEAFLTWGGFDPSHPPDPIAILGVTGGHRATDALELFPCAVADASGCYVNKFFLHGIRWFPSAHPRIAALQSGETLGLMPDISNPYDREAVAVRTSDAHDPHLIGYVPRYLARDVRELCRSCEPDCIRLSVERLNPGAPLQQRVLCRMNSCWPERFQPCDRKEFEPIPSDLQPVAP